MTSEESRCKRQLMQCGEQRGTDIANVVKLICAFMKKLLGWSYGLQLKLHAITGRQSFLDYRRE